jgi:AraC-like DNA-binding protein
MHIPVTAGAPTPMRIRGHEIDISFCALDVVSRWGNPSLRNSFWRCYLPITEGASIRSATADWPMHVNEVMLIPSDCPVSGHSDEPFALYYAHFNCSISLTTSIPSILTVPPWIRNALDKAAAGRHEFTFKTVMLQLVAYSLEAIDPALIRTPLTDKRIESARQIMKENLNTRLANRDLARMLNMSEASLLRLFRAAAGISPQKEHLHIRLNHAAALLQNTDKSIEQIASECGFWDRNHFTRVFTSEWKTPPARYRSSATLI